MRVCNITEIKFAPYVSKKDKIENNEIETDDVLQKQNSAVDIVHLSNAKRQEIQNILVAFKSLYFVSIWYTISVMTCS